MMPRVQRQQCRPLLHPIYQMMLIQPEMPSPNYELPAASHKLQVNSYKLQYKWHMCPGSYNKNPEEEQEEEVEEKK